MIILCKFLLILFERLQMRITFYLLPKQSDCSDLYTDLRDDKQFFIDHPGAVPISTQQVRTSTFIHAFLMSIPVLMILMRIILKGEELKRVIGAPYYIECSSKTQQVHYIRCSPPSISTFILYS